MGAWPHASPRVCHPWKVYNVSAKKLQRSYVWLHSRLIKSLKKNWLVLPKIVIRNLANFHQSTLKFLNWTLMASFCLKFKMYELKIYRGVMCHDNEQWCKTWRGSDLPVEEFTWGILQILTPGTWKSQTFAF